MWRVTGDAWRVRTYSGQLVADVAGVKAPMDGSGVAVVHVCATARATARQQLCPVHLVES